MNGSLVVSFDVWRCLRDRGQDAKTMAREMWVKFEGGSRGILTWTFCLNRNKNVTINYFGPRAILRTECPILRNDTCKLCVYICTLRCNFNNKKLTLFILFLPRAIHTYIHNGYISESIKLLIQLRFT